MKQNSCLLVNPKSNSGKTGSFIRMNEDLIRSYLKDPEFYYLNEDESLSDIAKHKSEEFRYIIACGGDGSVRNIASGLIHSDSVMGVLPLGSGNDFAKMLGLSKDIEENLKILNREKVISIDSVKVNSELFFNTLGIGFDGQTNYYASKMKYITGDLKYVIAGLKTLFKAKSFNVKLKNEKETLHFPSMMLIIANGKWEGGKYFVSPDSENNDGKLELISIKPISILNLATEFIRLSMGLTLREQLIEQHSLTECSIILDHNVYVHADGEILSQNDSFDICLIPGSLQVITA